MATDEIELKFSTEQLEGLRRNVKSAKRIRVPHTSDEDQDARVEAFVAGALFMAEILKKHKILIETDTETIVGAAVLFYPPYDPLPEPKKASHSDARLDGITQNS